MNDEHSSRAADVSGVEPPRRRRMAGLPLVLGVGVGVVLLCAVTAIVWVRRERRPFGGAMLTFRDGAKCRIDSWEFSYAHVRNDLPPVDVGPLFSPTVIEPVDRLAHASSPDIELYPLAFEGIEPHFDHDDLREIRWIGREGPGRVAIERLELHTKSRGLVTFFPDAHGELLFGGGAKVFTEAAPERRRASIALSIKTSDKECPQLVAVSLTRAVHGDAHVPLRAELQP